MKTKLRKPAKDCVVYRFREDGAVTKLATLHNMMATVGVAISEAFPRSFILKVGSSGMGELYRNGVDLGYVYPAGDTGWTSPSFGYAMLEGTFGKLEVVT